MTMHKPFNRRRSHNRQKAETQQDSDSKVVINECCSWARKVELPNFDGRVPIVIRLGTIMLLQETHAHGLISGWSTFTATKHLEQEPKMSGQCTKNTLLMGKRLATLIMMSASTAMQAKDPFLVLLGPIDPFLVSQFKSSRSPLMPMLAIPVLLPDPPDLTVAVTSYEMQSEQTVLREPACIPTATGLDITCSD